MKRFFFPLFSLLLIFTLTGCRPGSDPASNASRSGPEEYMDYYQLGGSFELPLIGATGYAAVNMLVLDTDSNILMTLNAGQGFTILSEDEDWWYIEVNNARGWVVNTFCFINLPDIIPSIVYNNTNTYSSLFRSSGLDIPNITGMALYEGKDFNSRLGREEFIAPVLYGMAAKIYAAQKAALMDGNTLIIYESFRPAEAHNELHRHFSDLVERNPTVRAGITAESFNIRWFLAEAPYNHQRGSAIDASLAVIDSSETRSTGPYLYRHITAYTEYPMQSPMHELSVAAAIMSSRIYSRSADGWHGAEISPKATNGTLLLFKYCTEAGLTPLSSEWWHYNDIENTALAIELDITGEFSIENTYSRPPW